MSLKLKVCDRENLHGILYTYVKVIDESWLTFGNFSVHKQKATKLRHYLTVFSSHLNNTFLKSFRFLQNLMRICKILQQLTRFHKTNNISWHFSGIILAFHEVLKYFDEFWFCFQYFWKMTPNFRFHLYRFKISKFRIWW